jgi:virginiamycin B lyase
LAGDTVRGGAIGGLNPIARIAGSVAFAACVVTLFPAAPAAEAHVYWASRGGGEGIGRANLDGTNVKSSFVPLDRFASSCGVAVDETHIYWGNNSVIRRTPSIGRAKLDGTGIDPSFAPAAGLVPQCGIGVAGDYVYWTNADPQKIPASIGRVKVDGTGVEQSFIPQADRFGSCSLAADATRIYYSPPPSRAGLDGSGAGAFLPGGGSACGIAVDSAHVYWLYSRSTTPVTTIMLARANLDGTGVELNWFGEVNACGLAVAGGLIYWADPDRGTIGRATLDGSEFESDFIHTGVQHPCGVAVDSSAPGAEQLKLGKPKRNRRRGIARLPVKVPSGGRVTLGGHGVRTVKRETVGADKLRMRVKLQDGKRKRLQRRGRAEARVRVVFEPDDGDKTSERKIVRLVKR